MAKSDPIHLDPAHKGAFHRWLGKPEDEKITDADIAKGLASSDPAVRMMARFAKARKKFKHAGGAK